MSHRVLLASLCLFAAAATPAATSQPPEKCAVAGVVRGKDGRPLAEVAVLASHGAATATDQHGRYCLPATAAAVATVSFTAPGFTPVESPPLELHPAFTRTLDVEMLPSFLEEVVVTGTRTERRLADTPVRTEVVSRSRIADAQARTLADALELIPGAQVGSMCQNCNFSELRLLGLEGPYTQVLVDSQPILSSLAMVYGLEHIPARLVDRLEVVKGGGSALHGAGAVAGVVNIIPHEPLRAGYAVELRQEWIDRIPTTAGNVTLDWASADQRFSLSTFFQKDRVRPVDLTGDGFTEIGVRELEVAGGRATALLFGGNAKLALALTVSDEYRRGGDRLDLPEHEAEIAESARSHRTAADLAFYHSLGPEMNWRLSVSHADTDRDTYYGSGRDPNAYGFSRSPMTIADTQFSARRGSHLLTAGAQYSNERLRDAQPAYDRFTDERYTNRALFLQDEWSPFPTFQVVAGARLDRHSALEEGVVSPRLAAVWFASPALTVRASLGSGFRAPQVFDEDLHVTQVGGEGQIIRNHPQLEPERSRSTLLSAEWIRSLQGGSAMFEVALFHTRLADTFHVIDDDDPDTPEAEFLRVNLGGARVRGAEVSLGASLRAVTVQLGWTVQRARLDEPEPDFGSRRIFRSPEQLGLAQLSWVVSRSLRATATARYLGSTTMPHYAGYIPENRLETTPAFVTLDTALARTIVLGGDRGPRLEITAGVRNLTDRYQRDLDQGPERDSGYIYGPRVPQTFYAALRLQR